MIVSGIVVKGKQEARTLGYPTANIDHACTGLESGVWTCCVYHAGQDHTGVAVIGMWRQTNQQLSLEVHILDFNGDLYDQMLEINIVSKLRDLKKFSGVEALVTQIEQDIALTRQQLLVIGDPLSSSGLTRGSIGNPDGFPPARE